MTPNKHKTLASLISVIISPVGSMVKINNDIQIDILLSYLMLLTLITHIPLFGHHENLTLPYLTYRLV